MTETPCPIGTLPIVEPDQYDGRRPALSPGRSMPVCRPKPNCVIHFCMPDSWRYFRAIVTVPTFDERARICATVIVSVPRSSASWMRRSATWIEYGSVNFVCGVTSCSESAAPIVTTLNTEPGSKTSDTAVFCCSPRVADLFASDDGACAIARIAPVFGSSTIAVACFAPHRATVARSTCSAFASIVWSSVRKTDLPGRTGRSALIEIG